MKHRRAQASLFLRLSGRVCVMLVALLLFSLAVVQFARLIDENIAMARELNATQNDISLLEARRARQVRELRRLQDPAGVVPEIHDRLRLVGRHEQIIFVSPAPSDSP